MVQIPLAWSRDIDGDSDKSQFGSLQLVTSFLHSSLLSGLGLSDFWSLVHESRWTD